MQIFYKQTINSLLDGVFLGKTTLQGTSIAVKGC